MSKLYESANLTSSRLRDEQHNRTFARTTIWVLTLALIGFLAWAAVTPVYEVVNGNGQIRPTGLVQRAEHLEGGIVAQIHVQEGDEVDQGALLVSLDQSAIISELERARSEEASLSDQFARAEALFSGDATRQSETDVALMAEGSFRLAQVDVLRAERRILEAELAASTIREEKLADEVAILAARQERLSRLIANELVAQDALEDANRDVVRLESELARLTGDRMVRQASINRSHAREVELLAGFQRETALELEDLRDRKVAARQSVAQLEDRLARSTVRAPISGVVQALSVANAGQVLEAGAVVAEVVPEGIGLFAEIEVSADRISGVTRGRPAALKILTHDFTRFGNIDAVVERVSPTSISREDGSSVFRVRLSFDEAAMGAQRRIGTGMTVTADIRTDRRTVLEYLLKPMRAIADGAMSES
ncbi:MAG: HlyD family type I secretion periplasmic adaptor subunit [Pseudomonadota bacterium]